MTFDEHGYLTPYDIVETDLETFEAVFVRAFGEKSKRQRWFENYLTYIEDLKELIGQPFTQWIDGSFVSRKFNPNDIDFLTFVDFERYERFEKGIDELRQRRFRRSLGTDGYFTRVYPIRHPLRHLYEIECKRWLFDFTNDPDTDRPKGILELKF